MMSKVKITTTINPDIVHAIDSYLKETKNRSRSKLIEDILRSWYMEQKRSEIEKKIEEYYLSLSEDEKKEDKEWTKIAAQSAKNLWKQNMNYPKRGEIYLVRLPGQPADKKMRPALIVSLNVRNRLANDVIVVPISTALRPAPTHVEISKGEGGLDRTSVGKCEQITTLDKSFLIRGPFSETISPAKMSEVEKAIQKAIGIILL